MNNKNAHIQNNIRKLLNEKGITHKWMAEQLKMNKCQFSDMLCGRRVIRAEIVPQIANILGCSCDDILGPNATES